jgi:hypothetical protein
MSLIHRQSFVGEMKIPADRTRPLLNVGSSENMRMILPLLMVVLVSTGCGARPHLSERQKCFCGLSQLNAGCEAWAVTSHLTNGAPVDWRSVTNYVSKTSTHCPATGSNYILTVVGKAPYCPTHGDLLLDREMRSWFDTWITTQHK